MAAKSKAKTPKSPSKFKSSIQNALGQVREVTSDPTFKVFTSVLAIFFGVFGVISSLSFISNFAQDYDLMTTLLRELSSADAVGNVFGLLGHRLGYLFVLKGFGIAGILIPIWFILLGLKTAFALNRIKPGKLIIHFTYFMLLISLVLNYPAPENASVYEGLSGYHVYHRIALIMGHQGVALLLFVSLLLYTILVRKLETLRVALPTKTPSLKSDSEEEVTEEDATDITIDTAPEVAPTLEPEPAITSYEPSTVTPEEDTEEEYAAMDIAPQAVPTVEPEEDEIDVTVEVHQESIEDDKAINKKVKDFGEYDPTLDLSRFQLPRIDLLEQYGDGQITFDKEEIEANKNRIVDTLQNYNIEIKEIKATIGPTVTLYEIVPAAGIRISKIKNLEDDIALSLAALGIRIIAPIPGKGTIGIEVPNANPQMVSMRQVIASKKFQEAKMELPVAMGRTITNENFVFDLAKMPHLLMAGATGQGKSVGLNAILTSLLYKKHPSQLKFVLVDPKKVELTLYNKIERHYLAILPDSDEAIITDTTKVINTLNSLCIEMDNRYELLKSAMVRNIKEYNAKFISRKLNPEEGHKYLPYIVLVIDEFADLIMTAGKEVEMPIARLAQLARAIGIHLIVATQRPSVNVITGIIKANFPARAAFRVTSKIDSRTILDAGGADQLIGKGDMLFSQGSDLVRLQCAFVDTPEVEEICDFIGNQQAYPTAYQLPEYVGEEGGGVGDIDPSDRDALFEDAARLVVQSQQGSTSMIQRKLKLGYNRAGRIVDQLEAAGILGPFEGSKARQVLVPDEMALEQKLNGDV
jgi:S-DNA-T family DNA segregation ATPase FtsK/SpoIIIE